MHNKKSNSKSIRLIANIFRQGDRIVYSTNFSFEQIAKYIKPAKVRKLTNEPILEHLSHLENRFRNEKHVKSIHNYITENQHNFILPTITLLTTKRFTVTPISPTWNELNKICNEKISKIQLQDSLISILEKVNGTISAFIDIPLEYFCEIDNNQHTITIGDGNHRVQVIKNVVESGIEEFNNMHIGVDFYLEPNAEERKKIFVALNSSLSVEESIKSFLMVNDLLSNATKDLIGFEHTTFMIKQFNERDTKKYIGLEPLDNIGANSKASMSFNILKNMLVNMTTGSTNSDKFVKLYSKDSSELRKILNETKTYLETIFDVVEPYAKVQGNTDKIPQLRKDYISLSGAGLYLIAYVAYESKQKGYDLQKVAQILSTLDWRRKIDQKPNLLFLGGILNTNGSVSNTRSAIKPNIKKIMDMVDMKIKL